MSAEAGGGRMRREFTFPDRPGFRLLVENGRLDFFAADWQLFSFPVSSAVETDAGTDADLSLYYSGETEENGVTKLVWRAENALWEKKEYVVSVCRDHVSYEMRVQGGGQPKGILYFRGGANSPAARYYVSACLYCQAEDMDYEREKRFVGQDLFMYPGMASPPPFVFPFFNDCNDSVMALGVAAERGKNVYSRLNVRYVKPQAMWLELPFDTGAAFETQWTAPTVWFGFGDSDFGLIAEYADWCRAYFGYPAPPDPARQPAWWKRPIFCGWLEQVFIMGNGSGRTKQAATQVNYEAMIARMDRAGLGPGIIIIDDKWQTDYGTMEPDADKWPDLRAFCDRRHAEGRKVLLWWRLWAPDGLSDTECIRDAGVNVTADPTSPAYRERLETVIRRLLGSGKGCMDCDGFKLDYIYRLPPSDICGAPYEPGVAGMELMHRYYETVYRIAKSVKPDALINTSVAHPYFADVFDQIRLHDYNAAQRSTVSIMRFRAAFVRAVFPNALIDTDGANFFTGNSQHILYHNRAAVSVGVPSLYGLWPLTDEELREIQSVWDEYEKRFVEIE
ncbi:MAG: hypothetical protein IJK02_03430 [Clostridia bacterium]|nr:hypothetical protein [Clostridia bacterium]